MKRHLRILIPVYVLLTFIVACGGGSEEPPPVAALPKITNDFKCAANRFGDALDKCKSGVQDILPLLLAQQGGGGNDLQTALLMQSLNKPKRQPAPTFALPNGDACPQPQVDRETTCKDDMVTAFLLLKSAPKSDGTLAINDPAYRKWIELKIRQYIQVASMQFNLNPLQQMQLGMSINAALNSGALNQALSAGDLSVLNQYVNTPQMLALATPPSNGGTAAGLPIATAPLNGGTPSGQPGLGSNPNAPVQTAARSTSLNLNTSSTINRSARSLVVDDSSKNPTAPPQMVTLSDLQRARSFGLPSSAVSRRLQP